MKKKAKSKCDCADVIVHNQVCDICQGIEEKPDQHLKKNYYDFDRWEGEPCIKITEYPKHSWELYPFCNDKYLTILLPKAPNIFYRWMMTLFFGFRWKKIVD